MISLNGHIDARTETDILEQDPDYPQSSVYTSVRTYHLKPFRLEDHLRRLEESARLDGFDLPFSIEVISQWVSDILQQETRGERFLKIISTPSHILVHSRNLVIDEKVYEGVTVVSKPVTRSNVKAKISDRAALDRAYQQALDEGAYEALLHDEGRDVITEGSRSNLFWVNNGILFWCDDALSGITQKVVLEFADQMGIQTKPSALAMGDIAHLEELFLTQTSRGIVPIVAVNGIPINQSQVGPITQRLMQAFEHFTRDAS